MQNLLGRGVLVVAVLVVACASSPGYGGPPPDGGGARCNPGTLPAITTEVLIGGGPDGAHRIAFPTFVGQAPGDNDTFYVLEKGGRVQIVRGGAVVGTLLDITDTLPIPDGQSENGLLGLAFHPDFASKTFTSFGQDNAGELYVVGYTTDAILAGPNDGIVLRIIGG